MGRFVIFWCTLCAATSSGAQTHEIRTPHFTVVTDAGAGVGENVATKLEQFRSLLENVFPGESATHDARVVVYAMSTRDGIAELVPSIWENNDARKPDGLYRAGPDKDLIAVRLDAPSEGRYATVYHEYFHVFARARFGTLPLWLDEGLAKFWEMTAIDSDRVRIGVPSRRNLRILTDEPSLPLPVLFSVDHDSPHYQDFDESAVFYAQSWAVVHYLLLGDESDETSRRLLEFMRGPPDAHFDSEGLEKRITDYTRRRQFAGIERSVPVTARVSATRLLREAEALTARAGFLVHGDTPERARPLLEHALALEPELATAHESFGFLWLRDGDTARALEAFARAAELDSSSFLAHYYHAVASLRAGSSIETVLDDLARSLEANPDFAPAHLFVATAVAELDADYARGIASAKRVVELTPDDLEGHQLLGRLLIASGDEQAGIDSYRRALELDSDEARVYRQLAFDLIEFDRYDEASGALERARALEPDDADTAFTLALALSEAGRVDEAIEAYERAAAMEPQASRYHYRLGELLLEQGRYAESVAALEKAHELSPESVAIRRDLGEALLGSGRAERAIPHLRAALGKAPRLGKLHYQLATALDATGDKASADKHFRMANELGYAP